MERRKLQATGGSSLTLTLPKAWLERFKMKSKDEVIVTSSGSSLIIKPLSKSRQKFLLSIDLDDKKPEWVLREIIGAYIAGSDQIELKARRITPEQNSIIRQTVQELFGFEILEETSSMIVAHSVIDNSLFPVGESARRAFAICHSMLEDALRAAKTDDKELAYDVTQRDREVNKLVYAIERQFVQVLEGRISGNAKELNFYSNVAMQLERIGDRAVIIGKLVHRHKDPITLSDNFPMIQKALGELLADIDALLKTPTVIAAHEILDKNPRLEPLMYGRRRVEQSYESAVIEDSFDRSRGRLMNVAELTIDYLLQKTA